MLSTILTAALTVGLVAGSPIQSGPSVQVKNGTYTGVYSPQYDQDFFLGMPYAQPPVGDLRFRTPLGLYNSTWYGSKPATQYSSEVSFFAPVLDICADSNP